MPDWNRYVRGHLPPLHVSPAREAEIVAELALQLEQAYSDALLRGLAEEEAARSAVEPFGDWNVIAREIDAEERREPPKLESAPGGLWSGIA